MIKVLLYLFPILINFLSGSMFYVTANRFTEAGAEKVYVSSTSAAWALTYFIGSLVVGRLVTERRAVPMIIAAALASGLQVVTADHNFPLYGVKTIK